MAKNKQTTETNKDSCVEQTLHKTQTDDHRHIYDDRVITSLGGGRTTIKTKIKHTHTLERVEITSSVRDSGKSHLPLMGMLFDSASIKNPKEASLNIYKLVKEHVSHSSQSIS